MQLTVTQKTALTSFFDGLVGAGLGFYAYAHDTEPLDLQADVTAIESGLLGAVQGLSTAIGEAGGAFALGMTPAAVAGAVANGAQASVQINNAATALANATSDAEAAAALKAMEDATAALLQDVGTMMMAFPLTAEFGLGLLTAGVIFQAAVDTGALSKLMDALKALGEFLSNDTTENGNYVDPIAALFSHSMVDPLVIDLTGSGIQLTSLSKSNAYFDLYGTGFAVHTGWVGAGTGILVKGVNASSVGGISSLFGSATEDGFSQLSSLDKNRDGLIDSNDPSYAGLGVWVDANGNGVADPGEVQSLQSLGITSINVIPSNDYQISNGNLITEVATYTRVDGTTGEIAEAYFDNSQVESQFQGQYQIDSAVLSLPNLRGYGTLPNLYVAMSADAVLMQMVKDFSSEDLSSAANFSSQVKNIIFQWAGVSGLPADSRGSYIDARELEVLEKFNGTTFRNGGNPTSLRQAQSLQAAFEQLAAAVEVRLLVQGPLSKYVSGAVFDYTADAIVGSTDLTSLVNSFALHQPSDPTNQKAYWISAARFIGEIGQGLGEDTSSSTSSLQAVFEQLGFPFSVAQAVAGNVLLGNGSSDSLVAYNSGPHFFDGGSGVRFEQSGGGGDTFYFQSGYGNLQINETDISTSANNVLQLGTGISYSQISVRATHDGTGLIISAGSSGDSVQLNQFLTSPVYGIQSVKFGDGTALSRQQLIALETTGTSADDVLYGTYDSETFDGHGGNDVEVGGGGGDTFYFGAGYGHLEINEYDYAANPHNVLKLGVGLDPSDVRVSTDAAGRNLLLTDVSTGDQVVLGDVLLGAGTGVQQVQFADGTTWTRQQLIQMELAGTAGSDVLFGASDGDGSVFDGKGGGDKEIGRGGGDTFVFQSGYGLLEIQENGGGGASPNTLKLGAGIDAASLVVTGRSDGAIVLTDGVGGDAITLDYGLTSNFFGVQSIAFADGTVWNHDQIVRAATTGTSGADVLYGSLNADVFDGHGGNDLEVGSGGNDTFIFNAGYGHLEINEVDTSSAADNVLKLGPGITQASIHVSQLNGRDIVITDGVSGDQITIDGMLGIGRGVQQVEFADGTSLTRQQLLQMVTSGTPGDDTLWGTSGNDTFDGMGGNDIEYGMGGSDVFIFNAGYGNLTVAENFSQSQQPVLQLGPGIDASALRVSATADGTGLVLADGIPGDQITLQGMLSVDWQHDLYRSGVAQVRLASGVTISAAQLLQMEMTGTTGNDTISGTAGADVLDGKGGTDLMIGNGGNDTFVFNAGYGSLEINEADYHKGANNVLQLGAGLAETAISVTSTADGTGLILTDSSTGDRITLDNMLNASYYGVQQVDFADGTTWSRQQLLQMETTGTSGADTLYGTSGADVFDGKGGNDIEIGKGGGDTFIFNVGYGSLEINELDTSGSSINVLRLGPGINLASLQVSAGDKGLVLTDGVSGDQITIDSMLSNSNAGVQQVQFSDGTTLTAAQLIQMIPPTVPGANMVYGTTGNDTLNGTSGADVFWGRGGNDTEIGMGGGDTFIFDAGYGHLDIQEVDTSTSTNVLKLGVGISPSSIAVSLNRQGGVVITDGISGDQITVDMMAQAATWAAYGYHIGIQQVLFADGTVWTAQQLLQKIPPPSAADDVLIGTSAAEVFDGKGGNDLVLGGGGGDTFVFNAGYGNLEITETDTSGAINTLYLGAGISQSSVVVSGTSGGNLLLTDGISGDQITVDYGLHGTSYGVGYGVEQVQFADGTVWSQQQLLQMATTGTTGNDSLYGFSGTDVFDGKGGSDTEIGQGANETYVLGQGYGQLTITNISTSGTAGGNLKIEGGDPSKIWLRRVGDNLQVDVMGTATEATIQNWFITPMYQLGKITVADGAAGNLMLDTQLNQLIQGMATFAGNHPGFDPTASSSSVITDPTLLNLVSTAWHH
ncbi:hemolysin [Ralstonia sp. CHL-2022]|uniref:Hemolysin n=1 Tax=Ralstonia mojiangensis TaxID=2953895 RepID=A0ABT2LDS4_9RALS|nr:calcium-binding protein [Ralstonia mojiangensis]MCT7294601.1 hemolysin [Ralstonia mojiangensis]MCT7312774.1 hemolysin [Ralstonia mojiangensis]